jgi:hypothetical protein
MLQIFFVGGALTNGHLAGSGFVTGRTFYLINRARTSRQWTARTNPATPPAPSIINTGDRFGGSRGIIKTFLSRG